MKRQILYSCSALLLCSILGFQLTAQPQDCSRPVPLPTATEPNIFSEEQEVHLGDAVAERIQKDYRVIEDPEITTYLTRIGNRLTAHLPLNKLRFQFFLVDLPDVNAFVLPGGRIYVSRKLVAAARTEDELASVIAHELGHLVAHHAAIDTTRMLKEALGIISVGDRRDIFEKYHRLIENENRKPGAFKARNREEQIEADQAGLFALVAAGYDPSAMATFWDRMTETKGKKGSWFSDLFGTTRPAERRLREMIKLAAAIPANCRQKPVASQNEDFKQWQANVISYSGLGRKEAVRGVISRQQLTPPLRSDILHLRFSLNGNYVLAQDDSGITVLSREPFEPRFRIDTPFDTYYANFTPDSRSVVFYTDNLRVERWSVAEEKMEDVKEVVLLKGCLQTRLSPDGKLLACLNPDFHLDLIDVSTGQSVWQKKNFYAPSYYSALLIWAALIVRGDDSGDLSLGLIHMRFSPDGRYFVAGTSSSDTVEALELPSLTKLSLPDSLKKLITNGFTFMGSDRLAGLNSGNVKKSAVVAFPSGQVLNELELWRDGMSAPTRGEYLMIRPIKDFAVGVIDINQKKITKASERAALDIFEPFFVAERRNGELGLYRVEKNEVVASALLPDPPLGRLRVTELSPDLKWVAVSGRSRGGVWDLTNGQAKLSLRGFEGAFLGDDGHFFAEFPKFQEAERNVAKFNLVSGDITPGPKIEAASARQYGAYVFVNKPAKTNEKRTSVEFAGEKIDAADYRKNTIIEMLDARTMTKLWSKHFPKEVPRVWVSAIHGNLAQVWNVKAEAARDEMKNDSRLSRQLASMKDKEGDYFVQIVDAANGNELGKLLIETGKGSFRLERVFAAGDWVIVTDTQNRVLTYSLKTGELKGRVFGSFATVSLSLNLLCVQNETGKLAFYDLNTLEKLHEMVFTSALSMVRFSADGRRLFILTANQTAYTLDASALAKPNS